MNASLIAILVGGLVMFFISLPLVFRKVPMNHLYGIRIPAAFESDERWYEINTYGGKKMAAWSWLIIATGALGFFVPPQYLQAYAWASIPVTFAAVLIPAFQISRWSRKSRIL